ncbi:MAG: hypothetical protein NTZ78_04055 [Candidatus Aureabacteria bacterium]|nr:hypothetical protein [Candidatus Auribacterota bacterium]
MMTFIIIAVALFASSIADAVPTHSPFPQCYDYLFSPDLERSASLPQARMAKPKIGNIIKGHNLIWGENIGWINLKTTRADLKIGSNILAGWVWVENCGWVCLGEGHPLNGKRYVNSGACEWGVNNDGKGTLSGFAWSEVTGWISFRTGHSQVSLDETGQFYGYAWGENVGWMHFGPGRTVQYLAEADPGPWREIEDKSRIMLARGSEDFEICSGSVPVTGLNNNHERYNKYGCTLCLLKTGRNDFCVHIWCCDTPVYISSLSRLFPIRAPPPMLSSDLFIKQRLALSKYS